MKNKTTLAIMFFIFFIFGNWGHCKLLTANQENVKQKELENYLKTAKIDPDRDKRGRRTEAYKVSLDDGKIKRGGFLKLTDRTRPNHPLPDSYKYGIAAYELDKLLDLNLVPPVVEREIEGGKGSLMIYLEGPLRESDRRRRKIEPPDPKIFENTLEELNVFENLIYSSALCEVGGDDLGDILIMHKEDWKVWRVDFSEAFAPSPELIPGCKITRCSKKLYQNLIKLDDKVLKAKLKHYLNEEEISMLLKRKKIIIEKIKQLIDEKGEDSVLFSSKSITTGI